MRIAVVGIIAVAVSFTALNWFTFLDGESAKFLDVRDATSGEVSELTTLADLYYGWLGFVLLAASGIAAVVANLPSVASSALRAFGALVGIGAAVATFFAVQVFGGGTTIGDFLDVAEVGYWVAIAGFVLIGLGAVIRPRPKTPYRSGAVG